MTNQCQPKRIRAGGDYKPKRNEPTTERRIRGGLNPWKGPRAQGSEKREELPVLRAS